MTVTQKLGERRASRIPRLRGDDGVLTRMLFANADVGKKISKHSHYLEVIPAKAGIHASCPYFSVHIDPASLWLLYYAFTSCVLSKGKEGPPNLFKDQK